MIERQVDAIIGLQMGDEGKGRFAHQLAANYPMVARFNGGANAGHTFSHNGREVNTHQIPSGITHEGVVNLITISSYVDPKALLEEANGLWEIGIPVSGRNLKVSDGANLVLPHHIMRDNIRELSKDGQGSTGRGISFVGSDKYERIGVTLNDFINDPQLVKSRVIEGIDGVNRSLDELFVSVMEDDDLEDSNREQLLENICNAVGVANLEWASWKEATGEIRAYETDTFEFIHEALGKGQTLLAEGAQSSGLDIEHGMRPETTSSHVTIGGALSSIGVGPRAIGEVYGVAKLPKSRVGGTPESFPTRITDEEIAARIRGNAGDIDGEYGKSTGRERMVGWLDLPELRRSVLVNEVTQLVFTKLDCIPRAGDYTQVATHFVGEDGQPVEIAPNFVSKVRKMKPEYEQLPTWEEDISGVRRFDELPENAKAYLEFIKSQLGVEITMVGVGPESEQFIDMRVAT